METTRRQVRCITGELLGEGEGGWWGVAVAVKRQQHAPRQAQEHTLLLHNGGLQADTRRKETRDEDEDDADDEHPEAVADLRGGVGNGE